jgi:hypothetical protein
MQKITVKEVKGPLGKGEKKFFAVVDENGAEFTTFDTKVGEIKPGSVINIAPKVEVKAGKTYINIETWEMVQEGVATAAGNGKEGGYKRDTEGIEFEYKLKARLQEIDRISIEQQTVWKGVVEILTHPPDEKLTQEAAARLRDLTLKAIAWASSRFDAAPKPAIPPAPATKPAIPPAPAPRPATESPPSPEAPDSEEAKEVDPLEPFANAGQMLQWCNDEHALSRTQVCEIIGCKPGELSSVDLVKAHGAIMDWLKANKPQEAPEMPFS